METRVIEFIGGPRDGDLWAAWDDRDQWYFPVMPSICLMDTTTYPEEVDLPKRAVYRAIYYLGRPSMSDSGAYRFEFTGIS